MQVPKSDFDSKVSMYSGQVMFCWECFVSLTQRKKQNSSLIACWLKQKIFISWNYVSQAFIFDFDIDRVFRCFLCKYNFLFCETLGLGVICKMFALLNKHNITLLHLLDNREQLMLLLQLLKLLYWSKANQAWFQHADIIEQQLPVCITVCVT